MRDRSDAMHDKRIDTCEAALGRACPLTARTPPHQIGIHTQTQRRLLLPIPPAPLSHTSFSLS